ncbi:MAG: peptidylprolyl isomerase [Gammaproteobacteria bacterium]|nr:peptidylprolyl isomerase [Gammaproteobacteria bacterium]
MTLHFSLLLQATGQEIDSTRRGKPATFTVGDGTLPEGVERALFGLAAGADEQIVLSPQAAFGDAREENLRMMPRAKFAADMALEPGVVVSFDGPGGHLPGVVKSLQGDLVVVDFNHPLAGKTLRFDVTILKVELS